MGMRQKNAELPALRAATCQSLCVWGVICTAALTFPHTRVLLIPVHFIPSSFHSFLHSYSFSLPIILPLSSNSIPLISPADILLCPHPAASRRRRRVGSVRGQRSQVRASGGCGVAGGQRGEAGEGAWEDWDLKLHTTWWILTRGCVWTCVGMAMCVIPVCGIWVAPRK